MSMVPFQLKLLSSKFINFRLSFFFSLFLFILFFSQYNAPIYKKDRAFGVVNFADTVLVRNSAACEKDGLCSYISEFATYFLPDGTISYSYGYQSDTPSGVFPDGFVLHTDSYVTSGKFLGKKFNIEVKVKGGKRFVTITEA